MLAYVHCINMQVWYDMAMDGKLWYDLYTQKWPIGIGLEAQLDHTKTTLEVTLFHCKHVHALNTACEVYGFESPIALKIGNGVCRFMK